MAKKNAESSETLGASDDSIAKQESSFEVLCEKGDFWHNGKFYNHHFLSLDDARRLIEEGYQYIKITDN